MQLPVATLTRFLSVVSNAMFKMVHTPCINGDASIMFQGDDVGEFSSILSRQMLDLKSSSLVLALPDGTLEKTLTHAYNAESLPNHVAVKSCRSVNGKREYDLYYGDRLVTARISFTSAGTNFRWKVSNMKRYFVNNLSST